MHIKSQLIIVLDLLLKPYY